VPKGGNPLPVVKPVIPKPNFLACRSIACAPVRPTAPVAPKTEKRWARMLPSFSAFASSTDPAVNAIGMSFRLGGVIALSTYLFISVASPTEFNI